MLGATSTWLWLVLLCKCSHAALAPLYGWTIDDSCQPYVDSLTDAFGNAAELTRVALEKLEIIRKIRPPPAESYGHDQWGNIDQNLQLAFGFENNEDTEYNSDLDPYWSNIYGILHHIL